jgi:hypothetical protein
MYKLIARTKKKCKYTKNADSKREAMTSERGAMTSERGP